MSWYQLSVAGCGSCICRNCMLWWSSRCPYGECFDSWRAQNEPYDAAHPNAPPRKEWTNWAQDQAYWCRGGVYYPASHCEHFAPYTGSVVKSCLLSNVQLWPDGHIQCSIVDTIGCEECYRRFEAEHIEIEDYEDEEKQ